MDSRRLSPKEFLRARRPSVFSDSTTEEVTVLDRPQLEYHLDSLTSRNQEMDFQRFATKLSERTICPNLVSQTGPTGGGDSKVDAETYPVAEDIAFTWYEGTDARAAASDRWAFAISTKKKWLDKVKADIANINGTGRGYKKVFFISNQFIPDKKRATAEDTLSKQYGIEVRILDRTWVLDRVFSGRHEELAITELRLDVPVQRRERKGPLDTQREEDLAELEQRIEAAPQNGGLNHGFVADCIEAAILVRNLERPRLDVDGRFLRAQNAAVKYGTGYQQFRSVYEWALAAYWYFEDSKEFTRLYTMAEERAKGSENAYVIELLSNLWTLLYTAGRSGRLGTVEAELEARTKTLAAELDRLAADEERPSVALQAQTSQHFMRLISSTSPAEADGALDGLLQVVERCEGLVGYPLEPFVKIMTEAGQAFGDRPAYERLFEALVQLSSKRKSDVVGARLLLQRGAQHLKADRPYDAIRTLGRALGRLYTNESRRELVQALFLCASALEEIELLWAARGTFLAAACIAANDFWSYEEITRGQAACYNRLKWLELRLGRIPHALAWHELDSLTRAALVSRGDDEEELGEGEVEFDVALGLLLLNGELWQVKRLSGLPASLEEVGLEAAAAALRYGLGYDEELGTGFAREEEDAASVLERFVRWRDMTTSVPMASAPVLCDERRITLASAILGCRIRAEADNASPCVELTESLLAALESLLATGLEDGLMAHQPDLTIDVRMTDFGEKPFSLQVEERSGKVRVQIRCTRFTPYGIPGEQQAAIKERLSTLVIEILARVFLVGDTERLEALIRDDLALERALSFTGTFGHLHNVLGNSPRTNLAAWTAKNGRTYPLKRREAWDAGIPKPERPAVPSTESPGEDRDVPEQMSRHAKHSRIETVSFIRVPLWERAGWSGVVYLTDPSNTQPPVLAPTFKNAQAAMEIFRCWKEEFGEEDKDERLRVTVIRGIYKDYPHAYRVLIGANLPPDSQREHGLTAIVTRALTMEAESGLNLDRFLEGYKAMGVYILVAALGADGGAPPRPLKVAGLVKRKLNVREAWEIGLNDIDSVGIQEDDDPILPSGVSDSVSDAPVLEVLRRKRKQNKGATQ